MFAKLETVLRHPTTAISVLKSKARERCRASFPNICRPLCLLSSLPLATHAQTCGNSTNYQMVERNNLQIVS